MADLFGKLRGEMSRVMIEDSITPADRDAAERDLLFGDGSDKDILGIEEAMAIAAPDCTSQGVIANPGALEKQPSSKIAAKVAETLGHQKIVGKTDITESGKSLKEGLFTTDEKSEQKEKQFDIDQEQKPQGSVAQAMTALKKKKTDHITEGAEDGISQTGGIPKKDPIKEPNPLDTIKVFNTKTNASVNQAREQRLQQKSILNGQKAAIGVMQKKPIIMASAELPANGEALDEGLVNRIRIHFDESKLSRLKKQKDALESKLAPSKAKIEELQNKIEAMEAKLQVDQANENDMNKKEEAKQNRDQGVR